MANFEFARLTPFCRRKRLKGNAEYEKLLAEKKDLQLRLNQFQEEFVQKHGRKILYETDKSEIQSEYDRYKVRFVKGFLS